MSELVIRNEIEQDYRIVENMTREAFWNQYVPGCDEHYVVHVMRKHPDFVPELDFVAELDGRIVGNVMYTKSRLTDENGQEKMILTFGPISVEPAFQRQGISRRMLEASFEKAIEMGYEAIVIFGHPGNYVSRGFKSCKKYNICLENNVYPTAMLVKELKEGFFDGRKWCFHESSACEIDDEEARKFDELFSYKEKKYQTSQEEFYIYSHSAIR